MSAKSVLDRYHAALWARRFTLRVPTTWARRGSKVWVCQMLRCQKYLPVVRRWRPVRWAVTTYEYQGAVEVSVALCFPRRHLENRSSGEWGGTASEDVRNHYRAVSRIRRGILCGGLDHLLTLDYRANMQDERLSQHHLTLFLRRCRREYGNYPYVAVLERQKRGACHWHLAVRGRVDVAWVRAAWRSIVGAGNIDAEAIRHPVAASAYLAKYMTKERHCWRRYRISRGLVQWASSEVYTEESDVDAILAEIVGAREVVWSYVGSSRKVFVVKEE